LPYVDLDSLDRVSSSSASSAPPSKRRAPTSIALLPLDHDAFRGESVEVAGTIRADGGSAADLPVEIYLQGPGGALRVGGATTDPDGRFRASFDVPRNLPLGDHRVVVRTPGDASRGASRSR
jgi:hypothetical protein